MANLQDPAPGAPRRWASWAGKPDPDPNPVDFSTAFGGSTQGQNVILAARGGPFMVGSPTWSSTGKRVKTVKTGDPHNPYKQVDASDDPYPVIDLRTGERSRRVPRGGQGGHPVVP